MKTQGISKVVRILPPSTQDGGLAGCIGIVLDVRGDDVLVETETDKVLVDRSRLMPLVEHTTVTPDKGLKYAA